MNANDVNISIIDRYGNQKLINYDFNAKSILPIGTIIAW